MDQKIDLLTKEELGQWLKISIPTICVWQKKGIIPFVKIGNVIRFEPSKVWKALERQGSRKVKK